MLCNSTFTASNLNTHRECMACPVAAEVLLPQAVCIAWPAICMQPHVILLAEQCARSSLVAKWYWTCAGNAEGFSITPFAAGHLLGGCAWRITTPGEEDIVYAVHYNHRKQARATLGCSHDAYEPCMTGSELVCDFLSHVEPEQALLSMLSLTAVRHECDPAAEGCPAGLAGSPECVHAVASLPAAHSPHHGCGQRLAQPSRQQGCPGQGPPGLSCLYTEKRRCVAASQTAAIYGKLVHMSRKAAACLSRCHRVPPNTAGLHCSSLGTALRCRCGRVLQAGPLRALPLLLDCTRAMLQAQIGGGPDAARVASASAHPHSNRCLCRQRAAACGCCGAGAGGAAAAGPALGPRQAVLHARVCGASGPPGARAGQDAAHLDVRRCPAGL